MTLKLGVSGISATFRSKRSYASERKAVRKAEVAELKAKKAEKCAKAEASKPKVNAAEVIAKGEAEIAKFKKIAAEKAAK